HKQHEEKRGDEIAILENFERHEGFSRGQHMDDEKLQTENGDKSLDDDFARREPVLGGAAIEHQLQAGKSEPQHRKSKPVEPELLVAVRVAQEQPNAGNGGDS